MEQNQNSKGETDSPQENAGEVARKSRIFIFNNGGPHRFLHACAIAEDGHVVAGHCCSHEGFMRHDMGMDGSDWKHDAYNAHYPQGWELEWVDGHKIETHPGIQAALKLNAALLEEVRQADMKQNQPVIAIVVSDSQRVTP